MGARAGNRLPNRPHARAADCGSAPGANQWDRGDCDLQRWLSMGRLYWTQTITALRGNLLGSGSLDDTLVDTFLGYCADPAWWTRTVAFTAVRGRASGG